MTSINNHLIIGLGGTGGKVIREFRKLYERESEINEDIKYEFLYLDTNPEFMQHGDPSWKVLGKSVQLDQARKARRAAGAETLDAGALRALARQPLRPVRPQQPLDVGLFEFRPPDAPHIIMPDE